MSSFRSYVSPWSKSSYSTPTSSSSYLRGSTGGGSTSHLSSSASNKDDKPYSSTGSYSRSRYGSSAIEKSSGDTGDGGSTAGISRDGGTTSSATSGYRSTLSSSTPSKSTATSRTSYRSPYSSSTLGSSSSTSGVGGGGTKDRSASRDRLGYLSSVSSPRGRATSPEPDDSTSKNASSLSSSYSSRPSTLRPISIPRTTSLRSRYKDEPDYSSPSSPSTAPAGLLRSPRADITPFKWTGRYSSGSSSGLRSPVGEVSPTVFGVSPEVKSEEGKAANAEPPASDKEKKEGDEKGDKKEENESGKPETISVVTRGTSPNPPTTYGRIRRYELAWQIQKEVPRPPKRESVDAEVQTDKVEEESTHSSRYSRLSSPSSRLSTSPWYMDRYSSGSSSYVPRTYSRYGSTPSPSVSKRPSPVRSSSGSLANSTNDSGAPDDDKDASSSKESSTSAPKSEGTRSRDTKTATLDKTTSKEELKIESTKTDSKSSEEPKTPSSKKSSQKTSEEPKTESKSSDSSKSKSTESSKLTDDSKTPSWKKALQKNSEETKTDNKSSEVSKSKSSEESKTMPPLKSISKSSDNVNSSKSETPSSEDPKIPAWKAALKQSLEVKVSSQNSSQKTSEDSKASLSKSETKAIEETETPSKNSSKSIEDSKPASEASKSSITKSEPKSSEEPKAPPGKSVTKANDESKSDSKANKVQPSKSETKSSEDTQVSSPSTTPKTPPWKAALKNAEDSKKTKSSSSASEASNSISSRVSEEKATEDISSALKETLRSEESIYPMTTEKEKETTSAPSFTNKARPSSACSSASSSPSRGRERSPSAGRGASRPPSVPTSAPSSRAGSSERTDPTSSSSRTSAGVKSLSSYSSNQDLSASQKRLSSPRPPPSPRPIQRSNSAANLQAVANKDFRKSTLNMAGEPAKSEPIETHKRTVKKKTTRSRTLGGSELSLPREPVSRSQLMLPLKPPPVGGKLVMPIALVLSDDDETSASSVDEGEDEEEVEENKFVGGGAAAKPPIPKKESPAEDTKSKPRVRRRGETGSWREAYKVEGDGGKKKGSSQSEASGEDSSGADRNRLKINKIRRQPSGELPWWMEGSKEAPPEGVIIRVDSSKDLATEKSTEDLNKDYDSGGEKRTLKLFRITREPSGELAWWLDENQSVPEGIVVKAPSTHNVPDIFSTEIANKSASESSSDKKKPIKLTRDPSGDIPWWVDGSKDAPPEGVIIRVDSSKDLATEKSAEDSSKDSDYGSGRKTLKLFKIARDPSGELPWWLDSNQAVPEGVIVKAPSSVNIAEMTSADASKNSSESSRSKKKPFKLMRDPSGEIAWWMDGRGEVPEGVIRMESSSSLASKGSSEGSKKKSGSHSASEKGKPIKPFKNPSGERAWWMEGSNEPLPDGIILIETTPSASSTSKSSEDKKPEKRKIMKIGRKPTGELALWMDGNNESGVICIEDSHSIASKHDSSEEGSKSSGIRTGKLIPIWRQPSGERAWWMEGSDSAVPEGVERVESSHSVAGSQGESSKLSRADSQEEGSGKSGGTRRRVWRVESGERAWWMEGNDASVPEGVQRIESTHSLGSVGAEVAKKAVAAKKGSAGASSSSESESESESSSSSSEEEVEDDMPMEGSSDEEEGEGEKKKREKEAVNGGIPRAELGVRTSPDGVEEVVGPESIERTTAGGVDTDKEEEEDEKEVMRRQKERARRNLRYFIGRHTNIDDLLGGEVAAPGESVAAMVAAVEASQRSDGRGVKIEKYDGVGSEDESSSPVEEVDPSQVRIHDSTAQTPTLLQQQTVTESTGSEHAAGRPPPPPPPPPLPGAKLDDVALQVYKDGDYGAYLDLEASISEQPEEFEGFQSNRKNSIVLRTQLSVRVHAVIEKLLNSEGRELRRALFSLKQIFQEDKDLVHEFVQNEGLACLIKVGSEADQNYQNYILRALGQVMLYVDGMNGVMAHNQTVQWLYSLIASRFRLVVKTALKLLLVFAEYVESNCLLLIRAVLTVDNAQDLPPWSNVMRLLKDYDTADTELLIYAMTLINRTLNGIPDQDTYYDQVDALEEQGMESVVQRYMSKQGTDLDLLRQFQIYEAVLHHEDGEEKGAPLKQLDETIRKTLRNRKSLADSDSSERRKSRRHSTGTSPMSQSLARQRHCNGHATLRLKPPYPGHEEEGEGEEESSSGSSHSPSPPATGTPTSPLNNHMQFNNGTSNKVNENVGVTPALRRRRERADRQRSFIREQQESGATLRASLGQTEDGKTERIENGNIATNGHHDTSGPWSQRLQKDANCNLESSGAEEGEGGERAAVRRIRRENTVRDLTQKLASQGGLLASPTEERVPRDIGDMSGIVSKAKEGLARSKSKADLRSPTDSTSSGRGGTQPEIKKSETELHWEELLNNSKRPLTLCDLDFTDLMEEDDVDVLSPALPTHGGLLPPPPPPPCVPMPPPPATRVPPAPPPVGGGFGRMPPPPPIGYSRPGLNPPAPAPPSPATLKKSKKTVKLFWKEVREDPVVLSKLSGRMRSSSSASMIWDEIQPVSIDTQKLEHLFESRAKDLIGKKQQELNKSKEIIVLDPKRSNAINIGMTKLPPPRSIKTAILKMDSTIVNREGIEKLLTMLPTEEERSRIQEAQSSNPDVPLGSAEQFLLTLASISELSARLKLWAFKLDYENSEKEVAEPLMDLKQGMETLRASKTFRSILSTLLSVGIFLNGSEVKGFQIEYLAKVPEVKDTVHKHSLLHHLCHIVMEKFPDSSDLYSEIGAITRASKVDFEELATSIQRMEQECKASWDHLKVIAKHDGSTMVKVKMSDFLADCAERIIVLGIVHRRVMNRFNKFLLWLGIPLHRVQDTKPNEFCKIISEFALEYRTTRERVLQQLEKKASHRERNKTRGKMITDVGKFRTKEDRADAELRQLLGSDFSEIESIHGSLPWRRQRKDAGNTRSRGLTDILRGTNGNECLGDNMTDGDDEILESLVKTATKGPSTRTTPRERKRTRHADRKSLRRTLKNGLSEEEKQHLAAYIKGY